MSISLTASPAPRVCPVISRADIAWICVATNDGHPLHLDVEFATKEAGFKDVVVPGHLLIGWTSEYLRDWSGSPSSIASWQIRFVSPVWPGEQVTLTGEILSSTNETADVKVTATTKEGKIASTATAKLKL